MNIVLFEGSELGAPLPKSDPRAVHVTTVLRRSLGERFDAGIVNGPMGKGWICAENDESYEVAFEWGDPPKTPLLDLELLIGLPRPQTARKVLLEASSLGVRRLVFFSGGRGEPSYASSTLWSTDEWRRHLVTGTAQAFDTRIPEVRHCANLVSALDTRASKRPLIGLDNYEATVALAAAPALREPGLSMAFGPERGWTPDERNDLRAAGAILAHLGSRVLRLETAVVAAVALARL